jgi:hypothetical protein
MYIRAAFALVLIALSGCTHIRSAESLEIYDERTGNTLSVVRAPLIFARDRTDVAAHARDYVTLVAVEVDHSGEYREYLLAYRWSTVDRRMSPPADPRAGQLEILCDGRAINLAAVEEMPISVSRPELLAPKHAHPVTHAYRIDVATLRFIANGHELTVRLPQEALATPYKIWSDGRMALGQFVARAAVP